MVSQDSIHDPSHQGPSEDHETPSMAESSSSHNTPSSASSLDSFTSDNMNDNAQFQLENVCNDVSPEFSEVGSCALTNKYQKIACLYEQEFPPSNDTFVYMARTPREGMGIPWDSQTGEPRIQPKRRPKTTPETTSPPNREPKISPPTNPPPRSSTDRELPKARRLQAAPPAYQTPVSEVASLDTMGTNIFSGISEETFPSNPPFPGPTYYQVNESMNSDGQNILAAQWNSPNLNGYSDASGPAPFEGDVDHSTIAVDHYSDLIGSHGMLEVGMNLSLQDMSSDGSNNVLCETQPGADLQFPQTDQVYADPNLRRSHGSFQSSDYPTFPALLPLGDFEVGWNPNPTIVMPTCPPMNPGLSTSSSGPQQSSAKPPPSWNAMGRYEYGDDQNRRGL